MNSRQKTDMMEATRLTREGRLQEAMAVLYGALGVASPSQSTDDGSPMPAGGTPPFLDMVAPPNGTAGAWTSPQLSDAEHTGVAGSTSRLHLPEALPGLFRRMRRRGSLASLPEFDGLSAPAVVPAPGSLPDGAKFEERAYANGAGRRAYKLYVPSGRDGRALPLVVMLHGCKQSPDDFAAGTRMNDLAEEQNFLVAYPAQTQSDNASKCWNWFNEGDQQRERGEPSLIAGITRQIMRDFPIEPGRIYVAGLSAGGAAAAIMGFAYPDLYAAIGVHSGLACGAARDLPSAFAAMRQGGPAVTRRHGSQGVVPIIVFHGDRDKTVNPINGDQVIAQANPGADLRTAVSRGAAPGGIRYTRTVQADLTGRPMLEQWVLHGAGHAWSGGSAAGSFTEPRGPDASRAMMRFFLQHTTAAAPPSRTP